MAESRSQVHADRAPSFDSDSRQSGCKVVRLTPAGRGAIASLRIEGAAAETLVSNHFQSARGLAIEQAAFGEIVFGRWGQQPSEEVVLCRLAPGQVEVHCHGGDSAVERIVRQLTADGAQRVDWMHWKSSDASDTIRLEASWSLAEATTRLAARVLLDQWQGALGAKVAFLQQQLRDEVELPMIAQQLSSLIARSSFGMHLVRPWQVALAGAANVGKSSLLNSLAGFERAIVYDMPGTTRDAVCVRLTLGGWPVELIDTAGQRPSDDKLEQAAIEQANNWLAAADLVLLVCDRSQPPAAVECSLALRWPTARVIWSKADLPVHEQRASGANFEVSAATGAGVQSLACQIAEWLVPDPPAAGEAVPFTARQLQRLMAAHAAIIAGDRPAACEELDGLVYGPALGGDQTSTR